MVVKQNFCCIFDFWFSWRKLRRFAEMDSLCLIQYSIRGDAQDSRPHGSPFLLRVCFFSWIFFISSHSQYLKTQKEKILTGLHFSTDIPQGVSNTLWTFHIGHFTQWHRVFKTLWTLCLKGHPELVIYFQASLRKIPGNLCWFPGSSAVLFISY